MKKLRPLLLCLALSLLLVNCEEEMEIQQANAKQNGVKHHILTGNAARRKKEELVAHLKKPGTNGLENLKRQLGGNSNFRTLADVEGMIDYTYVYEVKYANGDANYSYRLNDPKTTEHNFFNVVFKKRGSLSKSVVVEYNMTSSFAEDYHGLKRDFDEFTGTVQIATLGVDEGFPCEEEPNIPIPVEGGKGPGGSGGPGSGGSGGSGSGSGGNNNPGYSYNQNLVNAQYMAISFNVAVTDDDPHGDDSGEEGESDDEDWIEVSRSPRYFRTGGAQPGLGDPTDPCGDAEEIGIIEPDPHADNCAELKKLTDDENYKESFEYLQDKLSDDSEHGYSFKKDNEGVQPPELLPPGTSGSSTIRIPTGGYIYGASHSHPNDNKTMPMFSPEDVLVFYNLIKNYNYGGTNGSPLAMRHVFVYTVTTLNGTYALKVDNPLSIGLMQQLFSSEEQQRKFVMELKYKQKMKDPSDSAASFEIQFLKFIQSKNIGVALYKADEDLESWSKLSIDPDDNERIKETKC